VTLTMALLAPANAKDRDAQHATSPITSPWRSDTRCRCGGSARCVRTGTQSHNPVLTDPQFDGQTYTERFRRAKTLRNRVLEAE